MKRAAQERHMSPDGLAAGQSADGLVDHGLENRSGQVLLGGAVIDQRLNIGLGKYAAAGRDGIKGMATSVWGAVSPRAVATATTS